MAKTNTIITIGRQYGSAGREIGYKVAADLDIKLYDKEMLDRAAKESGICQELFETHDEKPTNSFLYSLVMDTYSTGYSSAAFSEMPLNHKVFLAQFDSIKKIAAEGPCVIVGRCADYALENMPNVVNVFLYADLTSRIVRIARRHELTDAKAKELIRKTLEAPNHWYTTFELSVLIKIPEEAPPSWTAVSPDIGAENSETKDSGIKRIMADALNDFLEVYQTSPAGMPEDPVWTHWLRKTSSLAVSLYENRLAMDFGTCLVPQFLDLFSYAKNLLRSEVLTPADRDNVWDIFSAFFSSTSILVDSINHSSRQFVQVPSFGSVSFEMPPKLMAYYTAMTHELIEVFRDDGYTYGVAFYPEFVYTLKVTSYADQDISKDEWLTISVGEQSLYTLQLTTETLGHEISHFVGGQNRRRDVREIRALQTSLAGLAGQLLKRLCRRLSEYCGLEREFPAAAGWSELYDLVEELTEGLRRTCLPVYAEKELYSRYLQNHLANLPIDILGVPGLINLLKEWLCGYLLDEQGELMPLLAKRFAQEIGGPGAVPHEASRLVYRARAKDCVYRLLIEELEDIANCNRDVEVGEESAMYDSAASSSSPGWVVYMFREAFADLQMILLFNLNWEDYQALFLQDEGLLSAEDCPPRMLAVARALVSAGKWQADSVQTAGYAKAGNSFAGIGEAVTLNLCPNSSRDEADAGSKRLQAMDFETDIIFYLSGCFVYC